MPPIGDFLYQLTPRDEQSIGMQLFVEANGSSAAAAAVTVELTIPAERLLIISHGIVRALAGAGQTISRLQLLRVNLSNREFDFRESQPGTLFDELTIEGPIILVTGEIIRAIGTFNAGVAANAVTLTLHGHTIPRGVVNV